MITGAQLKAIKRTLDKIEDCTQAHDYAAGVKELAGCMKRLSPSLVSWDERTRFFEDILNSVNQAAEQSEGLIEPTLELQRKADRAGYVLNLVRTDVTIPPDALDASIRFVVENKELISSPLVYEALVNQSVQGANLDLEVRRLAWRRICEHRAQRKAQPSGTTDAPSKILSFLTSALIPRLAPNSVSAPGDKLSSEELKRLREQLLRSRPTLGPRGSMIEAAECYSDRTDLVPALLAELASPATVERSEIALTLGEIGGNDVAVRLADALRSEVDAGSLDEDYQIYLASALSNIGGSDAVDGLLRASEKGSERVRLVALSGLESLSTAGAVALTEYSEPLSIDTEDMKDAYVELARRLRALTGASDAPPYVRGRAGQLLDTILISLSHAEFLP